MSDRDFMIDNLDARDVQNYQNIFCEAQRVFMTCYNSEGRNITLISGRNNELKMLYEKFGRDDIRTIIFKAVNAAKESKKMVWKDTKFINIRIVAIPNIYQDNYEGCWAMIVIYKQEEFMPGGKMEDIKGELYPTKGKFIKVTYNGANRAIKLLELFSQVYISAIHESTRANEKLKEISKNESSIKEELLKKNTIASILKDLESEDELEKVMFNTVNHISEYADMGIISIDKVGEKLQNIARYTNNETKEKNINVDSMLADFVKVYDGSSMLIFDHESNNEEVKNALEKYSIKRLIAVPVVTSKEPDIYIIFADYNVGTNWNIKVVKFLFEVTKLIQNFIYKRIAKNSLVSSYTALKGVIDNLGSDIFVLDKESREVLFANDRFATRLKENNDIRCYDYLFSPEKGLMKEYDPLKIGSLYLEKYDTIDEKWYEIGFNDIIWVDGRKVSLGNIVDVTEKKKYEKKIEFQANNDFLTGLYNRMKCEEDLKVLVAEAVQENKNGAILFIDLDNFKHINDGLGHKYGDVLLQNIAKTLNSIEGIHDRCYRVGGDEFIVVIEPAVFEQYNRIINEVQSVFSKTWNLKGGDYYCTMSMGIVNFPENGQDVDDLIKKADIAMYDAKKNGKNGFRNYSVGEDMSSLLKLDLEKNMRKAVAEGCEEFEVYIQPIVDCQNEKCLGGEALVRWNSKELGFLTPDEFIPLAEHLGLITPIGEFVLRKACTINKKWSDEGKDMRINVNLSVIQLMEKDIVERIRSIVEETGVKTSNLVLEVTESLAINDIERMKLIIREIRKMGIKIALDDFGTGYSSLSYIKQMDLDTIKVDRTFIKDIVEDDYAQSFVKLISELSQKLSMQVCVEGVEIRPQLDTVKDMNVSMIQGYYYGKPMKIKEFEDKFVNY